MPGGRPAKPALSLDELAKAMADLKAVGRKPSGEALALQISNNRGASQYATPALRERVAVSARWVIIQTVGLVKKHGETPITEKLSRLLRREQARQIARAREAQDPVSHQVDRLEKPGVVAGVNRPEGNLPAGEVEVAAGGKT